MTLAPIRRTVRVSWSPERAFERFTRELASWWPLASHSVGQHETETVLLEPRVGGEVIERIRGGTEAVWGHVLEWDPPAQFTMSWHPGKEASTATQVTVRFVPDGSGTLVELTHSGWEALGSLANTARRAYGLGWVYVLRLYAGRKSSPLVLGIGALTWLMAPLARRMEAKAGPMITRPRTAS
jgi:hypothetical protein